MASKREVDRASSTVQKMLLDQLTALRDQIDQRASALQGNPTSKAFAVFELREMILEHLDFEDVFVAMRVNRIFRITIFESNELQCKALLSHNKTLSFEDVSDTHDKSGVLYSSVSLPSYNPLLQMLPEAMGFVQKDALYRSPASASNKTTVDKLGRFQLCYQYSAWDYGFSESDAMQSEKSTGLKSLLHSKQGSWANTYITAYPLPVEVLFIKDPIFLVSADKRVTYELKAEQATMGALYHLCVLARKKFEREPAPTAVQRFFGLPS